MALRAFLGLEGIGDNALVFGAAIDGGGRNVGAVCFEATARDFDRS